MLLRAGERNSATVVMDKSLDSVHYADELMQLFPDMLFLNVVRDPRAQVASMNRAIIHDFDTALNAKAWVDAHRVAQGLATRYADRVLTIRYEDFLSNQEATLRQVCEILRYRLHAADAGYHPVKRGETDFATLCTVGVELLCAGCRQQG